MTCDIKLSDNIQPTTEQLKYIYECYIHDISYLQRVLTNYMKTCINVRYIVEYGRIKPLKTPIQIKIENEISKIKQEYIDKYSPYFK